MNIYIRMKSILLLFFLAISTVILITIFAINLWFQMSDVTISYNGRIAIFVGAFFTFLLGSGLMSLAYFSSKNGFDEQVDHNLDSLIKKLKDR